MEILNTPNEKLTAIAEEPQSRVSPGTIRQEYIEVEPGVQLHLTDGGDGRTVILIHGWPLSDEMYEYQFNKLMENNFRVIGITLRGFGKSDKPFGSYQYDVHARDIHTILNKLEISDAVLGGFSMGGSIAIRYVSMFKNDFVSKLALFGAAAPSWTQKIDFPFNLPVSAVDDLIKLCYEDRPKLMSNFAAIFSATETSLNAGIGNWLNGMCMSASPYATVQSLIALRDTDLRDDLKRIDIPVLILHGKKDKICSFDLAREMKNRISDSQLVSFEKSGHSLFLEETEKFNTELIKFAKAE